MSEYSPDFKNKKFNNYDNTKKEMYNNMFTNFYQKNKDQ